jgi:hypothetical protein
MTLLLMAPEKFHNLKPCHAGADAFHPPVRRHVPLPYPVTVNLKEKMHSKAPRTGEVSLKSLLLEVNLPSSTSKLPKQAIRLMYGLKIPNPKLIEVRTIY